jgi:TonB family protein
MLFYSVMALASIVVETNAEKPAPPPPVIMVPTVRTVSTPAPEKGRERSPIPKNNPGTWANTGDYPALALREQREGITAFTVDVSVDGRVTKCAITGSSGHADLDQVTCDNVTARAQFYPGKDKNGVATTGRYSNRVRWQIPEVLTMASMPRIAESLPRPPMPSNTAQLRIPANKYPAAALAEGKQGQTTFMLNVDSAGKILGCSITVSSSSPELDQQACALAREWSFEPALDTNGAPSSGKSAHTLSWRLPKSLAVVSMNAPRARPKTFPKPGSIGLTLEIDATGKRTRCEAQSEGALFAQIFDKNFLDLVCSGSGNLDVAPFLDSEGKPQAKRIKFRMSVEHEDLKTDAAGK